MHRDKQCVFPALRGNQHRVLSGNCSQLWADRQVRQPDWGALGLCSLLRRRDFSCIPKAFCCDGICNTALHVENNEGMEGPKKSDQVTKDGKQNKRIRLRRIVTGPSHDPRKASYKIQQKVLGTWERFQPKFLHETFLFLLPRKCKAHCRTPQPGKIFAERPFHICDYKRWLIHARTCKIHPYLNQPSENNCFSKYGGNKFNINHKYKKNISVK